MSKKEMAARILELERVLTETRCYLIETRGYLIMHMEDDHAATQSA